MMLALLIYCYANGIFSSRRIERATHRDIGVRFVAANSHPDHDTIATFRRDNMAAVSESFLQVLLLAKELKLVKLGVVSVDGSKFEATASKHRSVRYDRAGELIDQLKLEIADLMERAEASDGGAEEDPQALPKEIARRAALRDRLDAARRRLEAQAKACAEAERTDYEAKLAARGRRKGRAKGKHPRPPDGTPRAGEQSNLTDPDSRLMRKSKRHEFRQAYNAQAVVDAGGSQLIVGARITNCASDRNELVADIETTAAWPIAINVMVACRPTSGTTSSLPEGIHRHLGPRPRSNAPSQSLPRTEQAPHAVPSPVDLANATCSVQTDPTAVCVPS